MLEANDSQTETATDAVDDSPSGDVVSPWTIARYLRGDEAAIRSLAAYPRLLTVGGLLVLSAGFAREYNGEDLLREPWHLLISEHQPTDFPNHWSPPPHIALSRPTPPITNVMQVIVADEQAVAPWVRKLYLDKFRRALPKIFHYLTAPTEDEALPYLKILSQLSKDDWFRPDDGWRDQEVYDYIKRMPDNKDEAVSDETRALIEQIVDAVDGPQNDAQQNP